MKKNLFLAIILLAISTSLLAQKKDCKKFKNGHFVIPADGLSQQTLIIREDDIQTEHMYGLQDTMRFFVEWIDKCTYELIPTKDMLRSFPETSKDTKLTVTILETGKDYYLQESRFNNDDFVYKSKVYKLDNDDIDQQLQTVDLLQRYLVDKDFEKGILLFSKDEQESIREKQKDPILFERWCAAWTLSEESMARYKAKIRRGLADFIFEDDEWKIDEM